jgi:hypothetical protein
LVTGFAGEAAGVVLFYLGKGFGFGGAGGVASNAEDGGIELGWLDRGGVVGVPGEGAVAGFAVDVGMLAGFFGFEYVGVAGLTGLMAGKLDWARCYVVESVATIVSVLAEAPGDDEPADAEEGEEGDDEECGKAEEVSCIVEELHFCNAPCCWCRRPGESAAREHGGSVLG